MLLVVPVLCHNQTRLGAVRPQSTSIIRGEVCLGFGELRRCKRSVQLQKAVTVGPVTIVETSAQGTPRTRRKPGNWRAGFDCHTEFITVVGAVLVAFWFETEVTNEGKPVSTLLCLASVASSSSTKQAGNPAANSAFSSLVIDKTVNFLQIMQCIKRTPRS
jgi:hypothetical protein